ncbi:MAG: hypothetical protein AAF629_08050 [Chloroflexota bacterium]
MNVSQKIAQENSVLRWGGLSGILGGIIFILVIMVVAIFVGEDPAEPVGWIERYPSIRLARVAENGGYLLALIIWIPHFLGLYVALSRTSLAPTLFGSALAILGLTVLSAGALIHVATHPLATIYHGAEATPADQAALALMWQATWGVFEAVLGAGLSMVSIGLIFLSIAIFGSPAFSKGFGWFSLAIAAISIVAVAISLFDPSSIIISLSVISLIIFHFVLGWKTYRLSKVM